MRKRVKRVVLPTVALAVTAAVSAAGGLQAAPNRQCGVLKIRRGPVQVQTFGADGPSCKAARKIIRKTYGTRKVHRRYGSYRCKRGRFPLKWGCYSKTGSKNALAYFYDD